MATVAWAITANMVDDGGGTVRQRSTDGYYGQARTSETISSGDGSFAFTHNGSQIGVWLSNGASLPPNTGDGFKSGFIWVPLTSTTAFLLDKTGGGSSSLVVAAGDTLAVEIVGTSVRLKRNGTQIAQITGQNLTYPVSLGVNVQKDSSDRQIQAASITTASGGASVVSGVGAVSGLSAASSIGAKISAAAGGISGASNVAAIAPGSAARTSAASGNWADSATWVGGVPPGDGDTATISNGHAVTIAAGTAVVVGNPASPTTPAIATAGTGGTGILNVGAGATLTVKGYVTQGNATWTFAQGSSLNFNHATTALRWQIGDASSQANSKLVLSGVSGARVTVANLGAAAASFGDWVGWASGGKFNATFASFSGLGSASIPMYTSNGVGAAASFVLDDCLITGCGRIDLFNNWFAAGGTFRLRRTTIRATLDSSGYAVAMLVGNGVQSSIVLDRVRHEGCIAMLPQGASVTGASFSDIVGSTYPANTALGPWQLSNSGKGVGGTFDLMLGYTKFHATADPQTNLPNGAVSRLMYYNAGRGSLNAHPLYIGAAQATAINGGVWENAAGDEQGDWLEFIGDPATVTTLSVKNIIVLPGSGVQASGTFINVSYSGAATNWRITVEQNTVFTSRDSFGQAGILSENNTLGAGCFQSIQNNIFYSVSPSGTGRVVDQTGTSPTLAAGSYVTADYNACVNLTADVRYNTVLADSFSTSPGAHDFTTAPAFVDPTRKFLTWAASVNPAITTSQAVIDELMKRNDDSGWNSDFTPSAYYDWVRAGYAPTNQEYATGGASGARVGAVDAAILQTTVSAVGASAGVSSVNSTGAATASAYGVGTGAGAAAGLGLTIASGAGTGVCAASSVVTGAGAARVAGAGVSAGQATVAATPPGVIIAQGAGASAGVSTVAAGATVSAPGAGVSVGVSTVAAAGVALATVSGAGLSVGVAIAIGSARNRRGASYAVSYAPWGYGRRPENLVNGMRSNG